MTAHIWVGTDRWQQASGAEQALEYSIRKNATCEVVMHWMRSGEGEFKVAKEGTDDTWGVGHDGSQAWPKRGWGTPFSCFRVAVPELAGFTGKHIYLDSDMIVLGDVKELLELPIGKPWLSNNSLITDVSVIDCEPFGKVNWWPSIRKMRKGNYYLHQYRQLLKAHDWFDETLPWSWNCRDTYDASSKLVHYTSVPWQPWHPYPNVQYQRHPKQECVDLFNQTLQAARGTAL